MLRDGSAATRESRRDATTDRREDIASCSLDHIMSSTLARRAPASPHPTPHPLVQLRSIIHSLATTISKLGKMGGEEVSEWPTWRPFGVVGSGGGLEGDEAMGMGWGWVWVWGDGMGRDEHETIQQVKVLREP